MKKLVGKAVVYAKEGIQGYVMIELWDDGSVTWKPYELEDEKS
jgi:hypothetical protein